MDNNQDSMIVKYLMNLIEQLERKLAYPKNTWKRREELQAEIAEAKQRLEAVSGQSRSGGNTSSRNSTSQTAQRRSNTKHRDTDDRPARSLPRLLEVNYR